MIVTELAGGQPQAPMAHVSGNDATPFAQQLAGVTVPPVEVQSSAAVAADASPAAPTEMVRSHAPPASVTPSAMHHSHLGVIEGSGAMGDRVPGSFGQDVGTAEDRGKVRAAVVTSAGPDPELATYREQLSATGQVHLAEWKAIENGERVAVSMLGEQDLYAQQPRFERHLAARKGAIVKIEGGQRGLAVVISPPAPKDGGEGFAFSHDGVVRRHRRAGPG